MNIISSLKIGLQSTDITSGLGKENLVKYPQFLLEDEERADGLMISGLNFWQPNYTEKKTFRDEKKELRKTQEKKLRLFYSIPYWLLEYLWKKLFWAYSEN